MYYTIVLVWPQDTCSTKGDAKRRSCRRGETEKLVSAVKFANQVLRVLVTSAALKLGGVGKGGRSQR